jgi:hypothetical protein
MTLDEALEKVVLGYHARHDGMAANAHIYYEFNGWRMGFNHDGRVGSSSSWWADEADKEANWYITDAVVPPAWGNFQTIRWDIEAAVDAPFEQWKEAVQFSTNQTPMLSDDEPICVPTCWDAIAPAPPKPDTVKAGWEMFDRGKS